MAVKKNFGWMLIGRGGYAACQWLMIVVIARLGDSQGLGEFTYALAITSPIIMFSQLNLRAFMATDIKNQFLFRDYLTTRLTTIIIALSLIAGVVFLKNITLSFSLLILSVGTYKAIESISDLYYGVLQKNEDMRCVSVSLIYHGFFSLFSMAISIYFFNNILYGSSLIILTWLVLLIAYDKRNVSSEQKTGLVGDWRSVWNIYKTCFPLGVVMGLVTLRLSVPIYFIENYLGIQQVGYYSAVAYFLVAGNLIISSLIQAAAPRLAYYYQHKEAIKAAKFIVKLMTVVGAVGVVGLILSIYMGEYILTIFYGKDFGDLKKLLIWIICAGSVGFLAQIMGLILTVARLFRFQVFSNSVGIISVISCSYYLIPLYGIEGGAVALLAGNGFIFLFNTVFTVMNRSVFMAPEQAV